LLFYEIELLNFITRITTKWIIGDYFGDNQMMETPDQRIHNTTTQYCIYAILFLAKDSQVIVTFMDYSLSKSQ